MKNSVLLIFTVAFLFVISLTKTYAITCPTGMNGPDTITYNYTANCPITIIYCWKLSPGGILTTRVEWVGGTWGSPYNCIENFLQDANLNLMLNEAIALDLGTNNKGYGGSNPVPPCSSYTVVTFVLEKNQCNFLEHDAANGIMWLKPCDSPGICRRHYSACIDFSVSPPVPVITFISASLDPGSSCSDTFPTLPNPMTNGWQSGCFMNECE